MSPPPTFSGGGKWEAMHGEMSGYYEVRTTGPGRSQHRLFYILENGTEAALAERGFDRPQIAVINGMKPLGNPKENRERYWSGDVAGGAEIYRRHLHNGSYSTLIDLAESLDNDTACLLCFERDHAVCHRDVIVDSLRELRPGLAIDHL